MKFFPYGPFVIPKSRRSGLIESNRISLNLFWDAVNKEEEGLSDAVGCYIFSIRAGRGLLPWYVGLAKKQTFRKECFTSDKLIRYINEVVKRKGTPVLTLLPKITTTSRFAKPSKSGHKDIEFLETMLIGYCIRRNPNLFNIKDTKLLREMEVGGLLNNPRGRDSTPVTDFRMLLGV